jgi:hypothetical protein
MRKQEEGVGGSSAGSRLGANAGDVQVTTLAMSRQPRQSGSLQKRLEDAWLALDSIIQHDNLADEQNLAACEAALQRLLAAGTHLRGAPRSMAEAEKLSQN